MEGNFSAARGGGGSGTKIESAPTARSDDRTDRKRKGKAARTAPAVRDEDESFLKPVSRSDDASATKSGKTGGQAAAKAESASVLRKRLNVELSTVGTWFDTLFSLPLRLLVMRATILLE